MLCSPLSRRGDGASAPHQTRFLPRLRRVGVALSVVAALTALSPLAARSALAEGEGHPKIVLDHLEFPLELGATRYLKHLKRELQKEAQRVDWGASSDSTIQYRFKVTRLTVTRKEKVLTVSCSAVGLLPNGRSAVSKLTFSGDPAQHEKVVRNVLGIVARGVIARLAEIERVRRGELDAQRVREPSATE